MTNTRGILAPEAVEALRAGRLKFKVDPNLDEEVRNRLDGLDAEGILTYLASKDRSDELIFAREGRADSPSLVITSAEARDKTMGSRTMASLKALTDPMVERLPSFKRVVDRELAKVDQASCKGCKLGGVMRTLCANYLDQCRKAGVDPDVDTISAMIDPRSAAYLRTVHANLNRPGVREYRNPAVEIPPSAGGARPPCADCFRKHLGKAIVQLEEAELGYPHHFWLAMANLSEAEAEVLAAWPHLAVMVREVRIQMTEDRTYKPDLTQFFDEIDEVTAVNEGRA